MTGAIRSCRSEPATICWTFLISGCPDRADTSRVGEDQPLTNPVVQNYCSGFLRYDRRAGPRSCDPGTRERMAPTELPVGFPCGGLSSRPSVYPILPDAPDVPVELPQAVIVRRSSVVSVVAAKFRVEGSVLLAHIVMSIAPFDDAVEGTS
jgi:hypothetical protein